MTCELETTRVYSCCLFERISDCEESLQSCLALQGRETQACWESLLLTLLSGWASSMSWAWRSWPSPVLPHEASLSLKDHSALSQRPLSHFWFLCISWFCFNLGLVFVLYLFLSFALSCFGGPIFFESWNGLYFKKFKIFFKGETTKTHQ